MAAEQLRLHMSGPGPYGFRFIGGDKNPLSVSKIRPSSKAQVAGLLEGDVMLTINSTACNGLGHPAATALIESCSTGLSLLVLRGPNAVREVDSVMSSLGPEIHRLSEVEAKTMAQRHSGHVQTHSDNYANGDLDHEANFRLSAPPSGDSLKQIRISRRTSRSGSETQAPTIVVETAEKPGYYSREERTSTDGGKTTRIVEEVKTENVGGTTLTKVIKQEFTSYSSSPGRISATGQPEYSIVRSEDQGHPVTLGAPTHELHTDGDKNKTVLDDRGWTVTSNVERRSVKTQPYGVQIVATQEPSIKYTVNQDGGSQLRSEHISGQFGKQPIPAIEIHFDPTDGGFVQETRTSGETYPVVAAPNSNFEVRIGSDVAFHPKAQVHSTVRTSQTQYEFQPSSKPQSMKIIYEYPQIHAQSNVPLNSVSGEGQQSASERSFDPRLNSVGQSHAQGAYLHESTSDSRHSDLNPGQLQYNPAATVNIWTDVQPEFSVDPGPAHNSSSTIQNYYEQSREPEPSVKTSVHHYGIEASNQARRKGQFSNVKESHASQHHQKQNYSEGVAYIRDNHPQWKPSPDPGRPGNTTAPSGPTPGLQSDYNMASDDQQRGNTNALGHQRANQPPSVSNQYRPGPGYQYGQSLLEDTSQEDYSSSGHFAPSMSHPTSRDTRPPPSAAARNAAAWPNDRPQQDYSYDEAQYGPNAQTQSYNYEPIALKTSGQRQSEQPDLFHDRPAEFRAQATELRSDRAPPTKTALPPWKQQEEHYFQAEPSFSQKPFEGRENTGPTHSVPSGRPPAAPQQGKRERAPIAPAQSWIPGSRLPHKQPTNEYDGRDPRFEDWKRNPEPRVLNDVGNRYDDSVGDGWHEASAGGVKSHPLGDSWHKAPLGRVMSLQSVAPSHAYDPDQLQAEERQQQQQWKVDDTQRYNTIPRVNQASCPENERNYYASGEYSKWSPSVPDFGQTERHQGQKNIWQPPRMDRGPGYGGGPYDEAQESKESNEFTNHFGSVYHQPEHFAAPPPPPPPAPPLLPLMPGSPQVPLQPFQSQTTLAPPPPPSAPPIDQLKIYRGSASFDRSYGATTLEQRVKTANSLAHSVLSPENKNSRGQKLFLRRRDNAHKWTTHGPDPVPEPAAQPEPSRTLPNAWAPKAAPQQARPPHQQPSLAAQQTTFAGGSGRADAAPSEATPPTHYNLADDTALNSGRGGALFAKRRAKADKWASYESSGNQTNQIQYYSTGQGGGARDGDQVITNRLQDLIKPKPPPTGLWTQSASHPPPPPSGHTVLRGGQSRGAASYGNESASRGSAMDSGPAQGYRPIKFQGARAVSVPPSAPPSGPVQHLYQGTARLAPKSFGHKATVGRSSGYTDL